ncbi:MAG: NADH:flavin oxidoreductase/NADH oxidase family protein [Sphingomonadaceae bacterium]|nr:NADH:flavin oxidoreductase/NADH oxidase family protein [Sphingomonadaceae bacterium]
MAETALNAALDLPCGAAIPNRIAKSAMTEGLADARGRPTPELERLYGLWSDGGAGLLFSGNIQIDRDHLERPGNVILDRAPDAEMRAALTSWAKAATRGGNHFWAQLAHAGRQTQAIVNPHPKAPSAIPLALPGKQFGDPVALDGADIPILIERFAMAAKACKEAGFTGVQLHAAHGYLLSQFLNPNANQRSDGWGGSLENRARFLLRAFEAARAAVGSAFPISVKLNSADFQRGGFAFEDSLQVARWLEEAGVDLIEISGGSYEQPSMMGAGGATEGKQPEPGSSTAAREAYFVDFAKAMREKVSVPLMVTGGFRTRAAMEHALENGAADLIGLARPMCYDPDAPKHILEGGSELRRWENELHLLPKPLRFLAAIPAVKPIAGFAVQFWYYGQLYALGRTGRTNPNLSVFRAYREVEATHRALVEQREA